MPPGHKSPGNAFVLGGPAVANGKRHHLGDGLQQWAALGCGNAGGTDACEIEYLVHGSPPCRVRCGPGGERGGLACPLDAHRPRSAGHDLFDQIFGAGDMPQCDSRQATRVAVHRSGFGCCGASSRDLLPAEQEGGTPRRRACQHRLAPANDGANATQAGTLPHRISASRCLHSAVVFRPLLYRRGRDS